LERDELPELDALGRLRVRIEDEPLRRTRRPVVLDARQQLELKPSLRRIRRHRRTGRDVERVACRYVLRDVADEACVDVPVALNGALRLTEAREPRVGSIAAVQLAHSAGQLAQPEREQKHERKSRESRTFRTAGDEI